MKIIFADGLFAMLLIGANLYKFYLKGFGMHFWIAIIFVVVGLRYKEKAHSIWHIASALITILALL